MKAYRTEYLAIIETKEDFCSTVEAFNSLLQAYGSIQTLPDKVKYLDSTFDYSVQKGGVSDSGQVYFHVKFTSKKENLSDYKKFLRLVRTILQKVSVKNPEVIWDDISSELCAKAYPVIHELENLMRKLITKFMIISIGASWVSSAVPKEVSDSVKVKKSQQTIIYDADFIQLANFLFKKYSTANSDKLLAKLSKANSINDVDFSELKEMIPQSNWERYFVPLVNCNSDYLDARWRKLYDLRCIVAHNNFLSQDEFDEIIKVSAEVKEKLDEAIAGIDQLHVSDVQKEEVAESVVGTVSQQNADFLALWNSVLELIVDIFKLSKIGFAIDGKNVVPDPKICMRMLKDSDVIEQEVFDWFHDVNIFRNALVHGAVFNPQEYIETYINAAQNLREVLMSKYIDLL
ncbi:hypothetical protein SAMN05216185_103447 [Pseudomonas guariconensis]|uniref:HEPN domain-containing protein n=1 Tax=Pseudomonas guariconensis TaxID=1288410 RepID=UPI0008914562|nr:HEPN domain-containing protein [Pseudomonas guariconensis]SDC63275.1 hypothetical protein SAMN05216185_103447 [Pseudomonas guariconensis]